MEQRLAKLPSIARARATEKLQRFSIPQQDFSKIEFDDSGEILYTENKILVEAASSSPSPQTSLSVGKVFALHSNPGAPNTIYLDFDGHEITGTIWNKTVTTFNAAPYDRDGSPSTYSQPEIDDIASIWHRVAEDYAAFDVDVTTEAPFTFNESTARILITRNRDNNHQTMPHSSSGGAAYVGVWGRTDFPYYQPALVYYNNLAGGAPKYVAEAASHELGHNLGLSHDGTSTQSYYKGHGSGYTRWAPIMGLSYDKHVTQWSKGDYADANNTQDDITIIAEHLGLRADDHGDTNSTASYLYIDSTGSVASTNPETDPDNLNPENKGTISSRGDVDVFELSSGNGQINLTVTPAWQAHTDDRARGANLDIRVALLNASGSEIEVADPADETSATVQYSASAGTYFLSVSGVGSGDSAATYDDYGSEGQYFISGFVEPENSWNDDNNDPNDDDNDNGGEENGNDNNSGVNDLLFVENDFTSYGGSNQDVDGNVTLSDGGNTLRLVGNLWKAVSLPYTISSNTVIEFDFSSSNQGEIHGIGFDENKNLSENRIFQVYGSQTWGIQDFNNYGGDGSKKRYRIPVGQYYQGDMQYLFFAMDHDVNGPSGESVFANIKVSESVTQPVNTKPTVEITKPADSLTISQGTSLTLTAVANDQEEGNLSASIQWSSNTAGRLGTGPELSVALTEGQHTITAQVEDSVGAAAKDTVTVTVTVTSSEDNNPQNDDQIVFNMDGFESYGGSSQDVNGSVSLSADGSNLTVTGNTWKAFALPYNVTPYTIIEFDFSSSHQGEIQGIGFDSDNELSAERIFELYGSQNWGIQNFHNYPGDGSTRTYRIPVGQYYQGKMQKLVFVSDHDINNPYALSQYSNLRIYESGSPLTNPISFKSEDFVSYGGSSQDVNGSVTLSDSGKTVSLKGNTWKAVALPTSVTANTVMTFNFSSSNQGEIQGIGFAKNTALNGNYFFQLYGTQQWGQSDYHNYSGNGSEQAYQIPLGQKFTGTFNYLIFAMDHDVGNPTGESTFSNIQLCEGC